MAPRATWKGYLKLSLVSCAVELYPASTQKDRVSFHLLSRETGNRLRRQMVDPETGEVVESPDQVRGYELGKHDYVILDEDEINGVAIESTHTIDIERFVPREEVDEVYLDTPYYLAPDGKVAEEAFGVIREAMREKSVVGLGRVVLYRRERIVMLEPRDKGLVATTLRYAYEVRSSADVFEDLAETKVGGETLDLATHIIERKLGHFEPDQFEDRYQTALLDLIKAKSGHRPLPKLDAPKPSNVINLMDALRRSIAVEKTEGNPSKAPAKGAGKGAGKGVKADKPQREAAKPATKGGSEEGGAEAARPRAKVPSKKVTNASSGQEDTSAVPARAVARKAAGRPPAKGSGRGIRRAG